MAAYDVMRKIKTVLIVVFGVPCLILIVVALLWTHFKGQGEIHVVAPAGDEVVVTVDGEEVARAAAGEHLKLDLDQGVHDVDLALQRVNVHTSYSLEIDSGFDHKLLPASGAQCFAEVDVADFYFENRKIKDGIPPRPELEARHDGQSVIDIDSDAVFSEGELPHEITEGSSLMMFLEVPCAMLSASDEQILVEHLGFYGHEG